MAERVIARVNPQIQEPHYRFRFNNHRTAEPDSLHAEQRKSATYYALTGEGIPAFGIETSIGLCSGDFADEIAATIVFVGQNLESNGITY
jgi:hypothetical protein